MSATKPKYIIKKKTTLPHAMITFNNTKEKGDAYEQYILEHLYSLDAGNRAWLWSNIPEEVMCDVGLIARMKNKE